MPTELLNEGNNWASRAKSAKHAEKACDGEQEGNIWPNDEFLLAGEQIDGNLDLQVSMLFSVSTLHSDSIYSVVL